MHSIGREHPLSFLHLCAGMPIRQVRSLLQPRVLKAHTSDYFYYLHYLKTSRCLSGTRTPSSVAVCNLWPIFNQTMDNKQLHTAQGTQRNGDILSGKSIGQGLKHNIIVVFIKFHRDNSYEQAQRWKRSNQDVMFRYILPLSTSNQRKCWF